MAGSKARSFETAAGRAEILARRDFSLRRLGCNQSRVAEGQASVRREYAGAH